MAMLPMPFILGCSIAFQKLLAPRYAYFRQKVGLFNGRLSNNLSGITTIESFTDEYYETVRLEAVSNGYCQINTKSTALPAACIPLIWILILAAFRVLLILGVMEAFAGRLTVGAYSLLVFLVQILLWPSTRLGDTFDLYKMAMASTN